MSELAWWVPRILLLLLVCAVGAVVGGGVGFYGGLFLLSRGGYGDESGSAPIYVALWAAGIGGLCGLGAASAAGIRVLRDELQRRGPTR